MRPPMTIALRAERRATASRPAAAGCNRPTDASDEGRVS
jgi:hypothetical protein